MSTSDLMPKSGPTLNFVDESVPSSISLRRPRQNQSEADSKLVRKMLQPQALSVLLTL